MTMNYSEALIDNYTDGASIYNESSTVSYKSFPFNDVIRNRTVLTASVMFSLGVFGNVLALVLMATSQPEQRKTIFYKLMAGLAFTDLIGTCATSPVVITIYATSTVLDSDQPLCHYFSFMMIFAGFATMSLVCAMAIERYICLCHPYTYHCSLPKSYARYAIVISWFLSVLIACLPLIGLGHNNAQYPGTWCFFNSTSRATKDVAFNYIYAIIALIAIIITFLCNLAVIFTVLTRRRRLNALNALKNPGLKQSRSLVQRFAELHMVVMLCGVTVIFTSCFAPLMVFTIICQTDLIKHINVDKTYLYMIRMASFNQILDPWVYILVRRELRWKVISFIRKVCGIRSDAGLKEQQAATTPTSPYKSSESELTFWTFCYRCLCDPPSQRTSYSASSWGSGLYLRSPSYMPRASSTDSMLRGGLCTIAQPSPTEDLLLRKFAAGSKIDKQYQNGHQNGIQDVPQQQIDPCVTFS
ncbi:prostaglandin E2 receptor EP4 subtype [Biomphalaria glabrata]|uniref:Thromboxane A2 receptor n=1 Tax=Biomphalaria glabrata TaxID=6526 RepID=A0A2C9JHN1_BIOGL|nr:prostaglandin E2 receptor EP4 subtype [Biomphalaria glabrata]